MGALKPDTQNFNRLLVSLGLVAFAAALVLPWLVYRDTGVLTIPTARLATFSSHARATLLQRQKVDEAVQSALPFAAAIFATTGLVLLAWGANRMREAQSWEDRGLRAQTKQQEASIEPQTAEEKEERVHEAQVEELLTAQSADVSAAEQLPVSSQTGPPAGSGRVGLRIPRRDEIREIEREVAGRIHQLAPDGYHFTSEVKVSSKEGLVVLLDGLLESRSVSNPDVVIEMKIRNAGLAMPPRLDADRLLATLVRYRAVTGRRCVGWQVVVILGEVEDPQTLEGFTERLQAALRPFAACTLVRRGQIGKLSLPQLESLAEPGSIVA